jgi:type I restriction-modification system DNA methylase subunit
MLSVLDEKFRGDYTRSFDALLEFLAVNNCPYAINQIPDRLEWLLKDLKTYERLVEAYDGEAVKRDFDSLGDIYIENLGRISQSSRGQFFSPEQVCRFMAKMVAADRPEKKDGKILVCDPAVGSGRMLLAAYEEFGDDAAYFGVDVDRRALQIAFVNASHERIQGFYLLHADSLLHDTRPNSPNWKYANRLWGPSYWDELVTCWESKAEEPAPNIKAEMELKSDGHEKLPGKQKEEGGEQLRLFG